MHLTVSVAMTTYKSKRFIEEQLESIWHQTRLPDQLVISDDVSPDDTFEVVKELVSKAPKHIKCVLNKNSQNLGHVKNFELAFSKCNGDIIFPCDADDIWKETKIEELTSILETMKRLFLLFAMRKL